jgi:hypothetical protein
MDLSALESISKALEKSLDFWGLLLLLSTAVVVLGLVVEYWHDVKEFWIIVRWPMAAFPWDKFKTLFGGILVTLGVAGELFFTYKASRVENDLRHNSHKIEVLLTQQAGDAATSAKTAHEELDAVRREADSIQTRLDAAAIQLSGLEKDVLIQGPRSKLLDVNKTKFVNRMKPFAGQSILVMWCGTMWNAPAEQFELAMRMASSLGQAKWVASPTSWDSCPPAGVLNAAGNAMVVPDSADKSTKDAAAALLGILNEIGITTTMNNVTTIQAAILSKFGQRSPWELAVANPQSVVIFIRPNPMHPPLNSKKRKNP